MFDDEVAQPVNTQDWSKAYNQLRTIVSAGPGPRNEEDPLETENAIIIIKAVLLRNPIDDPVDVYRSWLLCAFVPWARVVPTVPQNPKGKLPSRPAAVVARDGIKADRHTVNLVEKAVIHLDDIVGAKDALINEPSATTSPLKRKHGSVTRSEQGMAIRRWGHHWRNIVMFALLTQTAEGSIESKDPLTLRVRSTKIAQATRNCWRATQSGS